MLVAMPVVGTRSGRTNASPTRALLSAPTLLEELDHRRDRRPDMHAHVGALELCSTPTDDDHRWSQLSPHRRRHRASAVVCTRTRSLRAIVCHRERGAPVVRTSHRRERSWPRRRSSKSWITNEIEDRTCTPTWALSSCARPRPTMIIAGLSSRRIVGAIAHLRLSALHSKPANHRVSSGTRCSGRTNVPPTRTLLTALWIV